MLGSVEVSRFRRCRSTRGATCLQSARHRLFGGSASRAACQLHRSERYPTRAELMPWCSLAQHADSSTRPNQIPALAALALTSVRSWCAQNAVTISRSGAPYLVPNRVQFTCCGIAVPQWQTRRCRPSALSRPVPRSKRNGEPAGALVRGGATADEGDRSPRWGRRAASACAGRCATCSSPVRVAWA
jgi:hypothetical protein